MVTVLISFHENYNSIWFDWLLWLLLFIVFCVAAATSAMLFSLTVGKENCTSVSDLQFQEVHQSFVRGSQAETWCKV